MVLYLENLKATQESEREVKRIFLVGKRISNRDKILLLILRIKYDRLTKRQSRVFSRI